MHYKSRGLTAQHSQLLLVITRLITTAAHDHMHACNNEQTICVREQPKGSAFLLLWANCTARACMYMHKLQLFILHLLHPLASAAQCMYLMHCMEEEGREQLVAVLQICNLLAITAPTSLQHH